MQELFWENTAGQRLRALHWPVENPKAVIALVHGQGEHIGRYGHLAAWFNARQVAVIGHDQQGFGKSAGKRGHFLRYDDLLNDVDLLLDRARAAYPGVPVFLYGHSMGGQVVLNFALRRRPQIAGLIATGPWVRLAFEAPVLKVAVGRLLKKIWPSLTLPTGLNANHISRDPDVVAAYLADPLVHDQVSAAAGIQMLFAARWLNQFAGPAPIRTLLLHGGDDRLTAAAATRELAARLTGDVTHREWPGLFHEIHNEKEQGEVFAHILDWMQHAN